MFSHKNRLGLGKGLGSGYKNLIPIDPLIHSLSAKGVKTVSIPRYMGKWYSQGRIPAWFDREDCGQQMAEYELEDEKINVTNKCLGNKDKIEGTARSVSKDNKRLKVNFGIPFVEGDYIIEYLSTDYEYVIIGHPTKKFLWILARDKKIPKKKYEELLKIAKDKGYDLDKITLNAKGKCKDVIPELNTPTVEVLSSEDFDDRFGDEYNQYEIGYATTKIFPNGDVHVFVKDSGDYERNGLLLMHELKEIEIWEDLVRNKCVNPNIADEMAHNKNPVKIEGVMPRYELDAST